jgi:hypothetical protein
LKASEISGWMMRVKTKHSFPGLADTHIHVEGTPAVNRRAFLQKSLALAGGCAVGLRAATAAEELDRLKPIGEAKGIHPGRVLWAHDPGVIDWKGPGDGHWWEGNRVKQERVDAMLASVVRELTGEATVAGAWSRLFRHLNRSRGKGEAGYRAGERIMIKPNWVGMIYLEGHVNLDTYTFIRRQDYMNKIGRASCRERVSTLV